MRREIAIIGDNFMLPDVFEEKLIDAIGPDHFIRKRQDNWPFPGFLRHFQNQLD